MGNCMSRCFLCDPMNFEAEERKIRLEDRYWYLAVPQEIGVFGQVILIVKRLEGDVNHICDITDPKLVSDPKRMNSILNGIHLVANKIKNELKDMNGREVEKVYVLTQCESNEDNDSHLHFQMYPRYHCDSTGNEYLYQCEWEEARMQQPPKIPPCEKINRGMAILNRNKKMIKQGNWVLLEKEKEEKIKSNVEALNQILN